MGVVATILYTLVGGLEAVIWTGGFAGASVKIAGVVVVLGVLISIMPGGAGAAFHLANDHGKFSLGSFNFDLTANGNFWVMLIYGAFWYLQKYAADQTLVQRYLSAKSDRDALKGVALGAVLCVPAWAAFMLIGTLLWAFYQLSGEALPPQLHDAKGQILSDQVFPYFLSTKIPAGGAGIFMAAMFSAAMSTMSSDLNCLSAVGVEDYYRRLRPNSTDRQRLYVAKGHCGHLRHRCRGYRRVHCAQGRQRVDLVLRGHRHRFRGPGRDVFAGVFQPARPPSGPLDLQHYRAHF